MASEQLLRARALVRSGELEQAELLIAGLDAVEGQRGRLALALRRGAQAEALALARDLAAGGYWDTTVAAALLICGGPDPSLEPTAERIVANAFEPIETYDFSDAIAALERDPASLSAWSAVLRCLILDARPGEGLKGVRIATGEGTVGASVWLVLVREALACDVPGLATLAAEEGVERFPDDADLWAVLALLRLGANDTAGAHEACERAIVLDPQIGLAWMARWAVAITEGRSEDAAHAAEVAERLGRTRLSTRSTPSGP